MLDKAMKSILIIFFLNIIILPFWALNKLEQEISDLEKSTTQDSILIRLYEEGYNQFRVSDPAKSIQYLKKLAVVHENMGDVDRKFDRFVRIGQMYHTLGMYPFALEYLFEASDYFLKVDDDIRLAWLYSDIGNVYFALGQFDIAEPYYNNGLDIMLDGDDKYGQSVMLSNIALCQGARGNYQESLKKLEIALKLRLELGGVYAIDHAKLLIAKHYATVGELAKSAKVYLEIWDENLYDEEYTDESKILKAVSGAALFSYYKSLGDNAIAEKYLDDSISLIEEVGDNFSLVSVLAQKANYLVEKNQNDDAIKIYREILESAKNHGFISKAHDYSDWLVQINLKVGNIGEVEKYYRDYSALTDSLLNQKNPENLVKLHSIIQNHLKEVENNHLKKQQIYSRRILIISIIFSFIIVIMISLIYIKDKKDFAKIKNLANASSEGIIVHDRGNIIDYNNQFKSMFQKTDSGLMPKNMLEYALNDGYEDLNRLLLADEKVELKTKLLSGNGKIIDVRITSRPYTYRHKEVRVAVIQDITNINQYINSLIETQKELKVLNTTKDRLFSVIAHDLKNPFNAIIGFSSLMKDSWKSIDADEVDEMLEMINESSISAHTLLENLLDWARIQTGQFKVNPTTFKLCNSIKESFSLLATSIKLKQIDVNIECDDSIKIFADSRMLNTIIRNLLTNSLKFTHVNGAINVKVSEDSESIKISVADNGVGISQEDLENMFKIDRITSNVGTNNEKGTGLGLILCKELVEIQKGKIIIESELGKGSNFTVLFPRKELI